MITLDNARLAKLISDKDDLVSVGRKITRDIENIELKINGFEAKEKAITAKVKPSAELEAKGNILVKEINERVKELEAIGKKIEEEKLSSIPKDMKEAHLKLMSDKEKLERERNKIALKIQKIKDKVVPIIKKEVTPLLKDEYDDIETAKVKNNKVEVTTFNHLAEFKSKFNKR